MISLLGKSLLELRELMTSWDQPAYRANQLFQAIYRRRLLRWSEAKTLPGELRKRLERECGPGPGRPEIRERYRSADGTVRYLLGLDDGASVETVLMPEDGTIYGAGVRSKGPPRRSLDGAGPRDTICLSTQVGCAVDCQFCLTALLGGQRNLTAGEILGQVLLVAAEHDLDPAVRPLNLVFMGQGEPLLNYQNTLAAVRLMADPGGLALSTRRMTLSTAGIVPGITQLGGEAIRPKLAVSLNASTDEQRTRLMPINKKWPIAVLLKACREFPLRPRERLTFEYVLLGGVNDSPADARRVVKLTAGLKAKANLIPWNPGPAMGFQTPKDEAVLAFQKILIDGGLATFIRKPRGRDIYAACGQLQGLRTED